MTSDIEEEKNKLEYILKLTKEELEKNNIAYSKVLQNTDKDDLLIYEMSNMYSGKIKKLEKALLAPYFARIEFRATDGSNAEKIYIGKTNIFDDDLNVQVVDWRAPISSVYYDGKIGKTQYKCPEGIINGELLHKRQYIIENAKLIDYRDIDITTNDQMLQDCLKEKSDIRLKNIVSTIQSEQNKIIRANMFKPLIVQGVAGSGKTTVALHRIAYLVYTYEKEFKPDEFLIIAPNKFFLDYISNVLPDLGVDNVRQETFEEFSLGIIGENLRIKNPNEEMSKIVNEGKERTKTIQKSAKFKSSMEFKEIIDNYLKEMEESILTEDFTILENVIFTKEELRKILIETLQRNSLKESIEILNNIIQRKVYNISEKLIDQITANRRKKLDSIDENMNIKQQQEIRNNIFEETEYEIEQLRKGGKKLVLNYINRLKPKKVIEYYKKIISNKNNMIKYIDEDTFDYINKEFKMNQKNKEFEFEDLTPILYIHYKIYGLNEKTKIKHIVIDEAQDLSEFQFYTLNEVLQRNKSITILGDISQGIYSYRGTNNWEKLNKKVFNGEANIKMLNNSYRTTVEIMEEANKIIYKIRDKEKINLANPIARHGDKVQYIHTDNFEDKMLKIEKRVNELKSKGYRNIAIITKSYNESKKINERLIKNNKDVELISEELKKYHGGITIVPSFLSKGLEFDNVIISDYKNYDESILDTKLLYVAFTRAMHTLDVYI